MHSYKLQLLFSYTLIYIKTSNMKKSKNFLTPHFNEQREKK